MIDRAAFIRSLAASLAAPALVAQAPRPFNILVLGDSISWGQGLNPDGKWRYLLHQKIQAKLGTRPVRSYAPKIHSGAVIGIGDRNEIGQPGLYQPGVDEKPSSFVDPPYGDLGGEIPSPTPTILAQLDALDQPPQQGVLFDLVVVSAGINDADITRFINPFQNKPYVESIIRLHCKEHLAALLDRIRTRCIEPNPSCRVVVLSYFRMISDQSVDFPTVSQLVSSLMHTQPGTKKMDSHTVNRAEKKAGQTDRADAAHGFDPTNKPVSEQPAIVKEMIANAKRFFDISQKAIDEAVIFANRVEPQSFIRVTPSIGPDEALFVHDASKARLWRVTFPSDQPIQPTDQVFMGRIPLCTSIYADKKNDSGLITCRIASIGHPNAAGAEFGYFAAIWAKLEPLIGN